MNTTLRLSLALSFGFACAAWAQPVNDDCNAALPIAPPSGYLSSRSPVTAMFGANGLTDFPFSCQSATNASVWYSFTPTVTGPYQLQTCDERAPGTTMSNTVLAIYEGGCGFLTELAQGCDDNFCSSQSRLVVRLTAGTTYLLQVAKQGTTLPLAADAVQLSVDIPSGSSTCDANVPSLPMFTTVPVSIQATETNDGQVGGGAACYAGIGQATNATVLTAPGRDVVHRFSAPRTGSYSFRLSNSPRAADGALYLTDSCTPAMTPPQLYSPPQCIAAANRQGLSAITQEEISCVPLTEGTEIYVWVDEGLPQTASPMSGASFGLEVSECVRETEPNDTPALAGSLTCPLTGSISPAADVDFYALGSAAPNARAFAMVEAGASGVNQATSFDLQLHVTNATSTLEFDENDLADPFGTTAPGVAGTPLAAGVEHYLRVQHRLPGSIAEPYLVYSVTQTTTPIAESEPNETPAQANLNAANYFSGTVTSTTDVDFFAFEAAKGELVYLAVDSNPSRTGSTASANHTLELWGADGMRMAVNDSTTAVNSTITTGTLDAGTPTSPSEHLIYRIPASGLYYARVGRTSATATAQADYLLSISRNCSTGGGVVAPALASLSPVTGSIQGGELVTLIGTGFGPSSRVTFGTGVASLERSTPTTLIVRTPIGDEGPVEVTVANLAGTSSLTDGFTYFVPIIPPTVSAVSPTAGAATGGTTLTIDGSLFKPGVEVSFDVGGVVVAGTNVVRVNVNQLTVVTPAHLPGSATIIIRNPVDNLQGSLADAYRFNEAPTITAVNPTFGATDGGTVVSLTGTFFRPGATVRFGATSATSVIIDGSGTAITATTPAAATNGPVDVVVTNTDSQQAISVDGYTYLFPPVQLSSISPTSGVSSGGTLITLTGADILAQPTVLVGGVEATAVTRVSPTSVTALTPPGSGVADVRLVNIDGQGQTLTGAFTYIPPPRITSVTPARGPAQGGTRITLTGQDFQPGVSFRIGGTPAMAVTMSGPNTLTGLTPSGPAGLADLQVVNVDGQSTTLVGGFTWDAAPSIAEVSPMTGSIAGGTVVTLTGAGFLTGAEVMFGTSPATGVMVASATELTAVAPAASIGVVGVSVRNPDGQAFERPSAFRYVSAPTLTEISPAMGDVSGGMVTRLTGSGFGAQTTVSFGGVASPLVTLVDSTHVDVVTPPHAMGGVDVTVANPDGATATLTSGFTFTRAAPTLRAVAPASGPEAGGTLITVTGTGFADGITVNVGTATATGVVLVSGELLRAVVPAHAAGAADVTVTNDDGQSATLPGAFTWFVAPDGQHGVASDGGTLGGPPDAGTGPTNPTGCGCSSLEGSVLAFAALGLLLRRRRAGRADQR